MASENDKDRSLGLDDESIVAGERTLSVEEELERNIDAMLQTGEPLPSAPPTAPHVPPPNGKQVAHGTVISEFPYDRPTPIMPEREADVDDNAVTVPAPVDYDALGISLTASSSPLPPPPDRLNPGSSVPPSSVPSIPPAVDIAAQNALSQIRAVMNGTHPSLNPSPLPRGYGIPRTAEDGPVIEIVAGDETEEDLLPYHELATEDPFALPPPHPSDPLADLPSEEPTREQLNVLDFRKLTDLVTQCSALFREKGIDLSFIHSDALCFHWKDEPLDSMTTAELIHAVMVEIMEHLSAHLFEQRVNVPQTKLGLYAGKLIHRIAYVDYRESTVDCDPASLRHFTMLRTLLAQHTVSDRVQSIAQVFIDTLDSQRLV